MKRIAIMTGGGDCPGLNAAIRSVTRVATNHYGYEVVGIQDGFEGLINNTTVPLGTSDVHGILRRGGTILGSSNRTNPFRYTGISGNEPEHDASDKAHDNVRTMQSDALIVVGGDGTLLLAGEFGRRYQIPVVGIPKTIDNDVHGSDYAIGFDSAVTTVTNAVDNLHTTAESHHRVILIEVMGRTAGWIALYAGVTGGADIVLIPERPYSMDGITRAIDDRRESDHNFTIAVIAEGIAGPDGEAVYRSQAGDPHEWKLGGVCAQLTEILTPSISQEVRSIVLGHLQRGGAPTAFDRALATQLGAGAVQYIAEGGTDAVIGLQGQSVVATSLAEVARGPRVVPDDHPMLIAATQMGMYLG